MSAHFSYSVTILSNSTALPNVTCNLMIFSHLSSDTENYRKLKRAATQNSSSLYFMVKAEGFILEAGTKQRHSLSSLLIQHLTAKGSARAVRQEKTSKAHRLKGKRCSVTCWCWRTKTRAPLFGVPTEPNTRGRTWLNLTGSEKPKFGRDLKQNSGFSIQYNEFAKMKLRNHSPLNKWRGSKAN